ncbi:DUF3987 domain-containing protein [Hymenobacter terrestris]|uniref:DUF3987 domain-containing protein n=1 Tax=Hymenobacter terrestris TaxID=2748310 RepID=A0ABX2Q1R8_9BACT|nr:DUF3987 domain-containing protein [Hymenobacter terrestris]NVO84889.1 DUF3987 domain-containing protein [Hymenobacter terrestris]
MVPAYFSYFTGGIKQTSPVGEVSLHLLSTIIKKRPKNKTARLRSLERKSEAYNELKSSFDYITPSGVFRSRKATALERASSIVGLDFDDVPSVKRFRSLLLKDQILGPSIVLLFKSPSGNGVKAFIATDQSQATHQEYFIAISNYIAHSCPDLKPFFDTSVGDIARACYLPYDPEVYVNEAYADSPLGALEAVLNINTLHKAIGESQVAQDSSKNFAAEQHHSSLLNKVERWTSAVEANDNFPDEYATWRDLGFSLASLGEPGRAFFHRISRLSNKYTNRETDQKFTSLLKNHNGLTTIKTFFYLCKKAGISPTTDKGESSPFNADAPTFAPNLYLSLPAFLQDCCKPFSCPRERDIMLLSTLGVLSGCFPKVTGVYRHDEVRANLFCFIVASAASGKSSMKWARQLAYPLHVAAQHESQQATQAKCEARQLYLPANTSAAAIIKLLASNAERGIICETEADTLSLALSQDWGSFSDLLRKAFHHEPYGYARKTGDELHELQCPQISIVLTGTPGQVRRLIPSSEDGLFSRFMHYSYNTEHTWSDVSPGNRYGNLADYFSPLSDQLTKIVKQNNRPIKVTLSKSCWSKLNTDGETALKAAVPYYGNDAGSVVKRVGLIMFRIAMILAVLRDFEKGATATGTIRCTAQDFDSASHIAQVLREHAYNLLKSMPNSISKSKVKDKQIIKLENIAEAQRLHSQGLSLRQISKAINVAFTTVGAWLKT